MSSTIADFIREADEVQNVTGGDSEYDVTVHLITGNELRGHVSLDPSGQTVTLNRRELESVKGRTLGPGGTADAPIHIRLDHIVYAHYSEGA